MAALTAKPPKSEERQGRLFFVLVVPALNEELVIANTVRHLLSLAGENYLVMVIDDGSDDATAAAVRAFKGPKVRLVTRRPPFARLGKGAALNYAYEAIVTSELPEMYGEDNIVMAVMDADGQVEPDLLQRIAAYFGASQTAAVQTAVRMLNAKENLITRWQQYEFVTFNWIFSRARESIGSGSLGGNGQFVRLSAPTSLGGQPWTDCLTEDLDLGLRLMLKGWPNHYAHEAKVYQQAVSSLRPLVRQRSRWFQGHLSCWRHVPAILVHDMPAFRKADVLNYLLAAALVLPLGLVSLAGILVMVASATLSFAP